MKRLKSDYMEQFFSEYLLESGYKAKTITTKIFCLKIFLRYLEEREDLKGLDFRDIGEKELKGYIKYVDEGISIRHKQPYKYRTKLGLFNCVKHLFRALYVKELILVNPCANLKFRVAGSDGLKEVLTEGEMGAFLDNLEIDTLRGLRDRAMFELIYSTGLRVSEVSCLNIEDLDKENRMVFIRHGKGAKDRIEPVSRVAMKFLKKYINLMGREKGALFLGNGGGRLKPAGINKRFKKLLKAKGLYRKGLSVHSIRHSVALHLLSHGADLRYVQELLGHESIETTVVYTNDLFDNIKRIYRTYHIRENEYYKEVDDDYLNRLYRFKKELVEQKAITRKRRKITKRWYEKNKFRYLKKKSSH